jgi:serine protease Do
MIFTLISCKNADAQTLSPDTKNTDSKVSPSIIDLQQQLHRIAEEELDTVVFIGTEKMVTQNYADPFDFFFNSPFDNRQRSQPKQRQYRQSGLGSGVIYRQKGGSYYIVTNNHVVEQADKITVTIDQNKSYEGKVVGSDPAVDIAIVKIDTKDQLPVAPFGESSSLRVGDFVIAIGNPYGLSGTVTFGIISALGRSDISQDKLNLTNFIQTDAAINPGNSGGPLLNLEGKVIGINAMIYSQSGGNVGIGFAIPVDIAKRIADAVIDQGKSTIDHGYLGVYFEELNKEKIDMLGLKEVKNGMLVSRVFEGSPAEKAGVKAGDVILEVNGKTLKKSSDLTMAVGNTSPGVKMSFKINREGKIINIDVVLGNRNDMKTAEENMKESELLQDYGLSLSELSPALRKQFKIPENLNGVIIAEVADGSRSMQAGLEKGDLIYKINQKRVKSVGDIKEILKDGSDNRNYFFILRNGREMIVMM